MRAPGRVRAAALALAARSSEPVSAYLYDLAALDRHAAGLRAGLPPAFELFYAVKANPEPHLLQTLAPHVHGFEVASGGELAQVRAQFPQMPVIFGGPGKTDAELALALETGTEVIHVESRSELERLAWTARTRGQIASVLLRVNLRVETLPETPLTMGGRPTPFGIDAAEVPACLSWLEEHPELRLRGIHFHLLSHQLDAGAHLRLLAAYAAQVRGWQAQHGLPLDLLNVGGGIGVNYRDPQRPFDWAAFCAGLPALAAQLPGVRWRLELGRYVTAGCGYYAMQVIDVKRTLGETFVVARGGTHQFRTPAAQGHSHPFEVLPVDPWPHPYARGSHEGGPVTVVGQLCTPKDVLAREVPVSRLRAGDLLLFPLAGAYAWNISHQQFLSHPAPAMVFLPLEERESMAVGPGGLVQA
ncbi:type III PLP-dependent enzyme [Deinococcus hohokamensis]|uniref:Type III PLP-dependent enzyme n=1 Tax=Deinococcus hohokamensis TaxID=309883 RepID=A0ABV9I8X2_9DEIO